MSNSKQKGAQFERDVCKKLSLWVSGGSRNDLFWRSAMSGGRATLDLAKSPNGGDHSQAGDISYVHEMGRELLDQFVIECKHYKDLKTTNLFFGQPQGELHRFWNELKELGIAINRSPLLICRQNNRPTLIVFDTEGFDYMEQCLLAHPEEQDAFYISEYPFLNAHFCDFDTFLATASPLKL